jgi:hypothetical protein
VSRTWIEDLERRARLADAGIVEGLSHVPMCVYRAVLEANESLELRADRDRRAFRGTCIIAAFWLLIAAIVYFSK